MNFSQNSYIVNIIYIVSRGGSLTIMDNTVNLSLRPYDDSMWDNYSLYDNATYIWDRDLNVEKIFKRVTGNLIKSYRCIMKDPYELKHK